MKNTLLYLVFLLLAFGCQDDCPESRLPNACKQYDDIPCLNNYTCVDEICQCPSDFTYDNQCIIFQNPDYVWVGTPGCSCLDTFLIEFEPPTSTDNTSFLTYATRDQIISKNLGFAEYFVRPQGDSIRMYYIPIQCEAISGAGARPIFRGRMSQDKNSIVGIIEFLTNGTAKVIATCEMVLRKRK